MELLLEAINDYVIDGIEIQDLEVEFERYIRKNPESEIDNIDKYIRVVKLMQASAIFDDEQLARMYTYTYGLSRCKAIFEVINGLADLKKIIRNLENTLVVDFGCGPATVALAFAYYYHRMAKREAIVKINYIGKDLSSHMIYLAKDILECDLFYNEKNTTCLKSKSIGDNFIPNEKIGRAHV